MKSFLIVFGLLVVSGVAPAQQYLASTVAGTATSPGWSGDGGPALSAQFSNPIRVTVDPAGNLYIVDYSNYSVRKVDKVSGTITTVAGAGSIGFSGDGGPTPGSQLSAVLDVAVDGTGRVFIADSLNARVRMVDTEGYIYTFAGTGTRGYDGDGGRADSARLTSPAGLAVDAAGNVYIADSGNATVRKVNAQTGVITTVAGIGYSVFGAAPGDGGLATKAYLSQPHTVKVDAAGNVYVGDIGTSSIRKIGTDGKISTYATNFVAQNFALDGAGTIYFADYRTNTIQKILAGGTRLWIGGNGTAGWSGDGGNATAAQFTLPYGVAVDSKGAVYVADAGNAAIRKLTPIPFSVGAIANAANLHAFDPPVSGSGDASDPIAPGEIVVLFGTGLGPDTLTVATPTGGLFPTTLAGTQVMVNGKAAPLIYTSAGLVAAIVPYAVNGLQTAQVSVVYQGKSSYVSTVPVAPTAPGVFTADASGSGQGAVRNQDGTLNSAANPAPVGSIITLYATGEGQTTPNGVDGKLATGAGLPPSPVQTVNVTVGGLPAVVNYAGGAPTLVAGVMQVNVQIPSGFAASNTVPVVVQVGGVNSPAVTIAVSAQ